MKLVVQKVGGGPVELIDVPRPLIGPTEVLVRSEATAVSPGTERATADLAQGSLLHKARARPDLVRQVAAKARREGVRRATDAVRSRLEGSIPLGYSGAGMVVEVGEAVVGIKPGDRVATGGAGKACHAEYQAIPGLLCAPIPDSLPAEEGAFATVSAIGLHAVRLGEVSIGDSVGVIGLGLIGRLTARLCLAAGCNVIGLDVKPERLGRYDDGINDMLDQADAARAAVADMTSGGGLDVVLVAASSKTAEPIERATQLLRHGGRVVVIGDVKLDIDRRAFYEKELDLKVSRSYGPGRYLTSYEGWGVDLPTQYVRWTEGRNIGAAVALMANGRLKVSDLISHRFQIDEAPQAYRQLQEQPHLSMGMIFEYPDTPRPPATRRPSAAVAGKGGVGIIGAGAFASSVLIPELKKAGAELRSIASASGVSARTAAKRFEIDSVAEDAAEILEDPSIGTVVVSTTHDSHARLVVAALEHGKDVYCEKPLALSLEELQEVEDAWRESGKVLFIGFNRRWSGPVVQVKDVLSGSTGPLVISYRVNSGQVDSGHWYNDRRQGGRLIGEGCHFVDTAAAIVGNVPLRASAMAGGDVELLLSEEFVIQLSFPDGSLASIVYTSKGAPTTGKESIEILGRGRTLRLDDFHTLHIGGKTTKTPQDKGHLTAIRTFLNAAKSGDSSITEELLGTMRSTLQAAGTLGLTTSQEWNNQT